jgi:Rrf2 family protein
MITRDTDYALRAVCFIASRKPKIVPVTELVKELKIPRPFLRKILQVLNKNNILKSYKGMGGGFELAEPAGKIYLTDLIRIFQGRLKLNECFFRKKICPNVKTCLLKKKLDGIEKYVLSELASVDLAQLIK